MRFAFVSGLALVAGTTSLGAEPRPARIPIAKFAALPDISKPVLSPDGKLLVGQSTVNGNTSLIIIDADRPESVGKVIPLGKPSVASVTWAGSKRLLLQARITRKFGDNEIPFLRLVAIDVNTGYTRQLDPKSKGFFTGNVLYTDPAGGWALVSSQNSGFTYPSVKRVDLATGDAVVVEKEREKVWRWYADDKGVVRAGIAFDGPRWTIWYRDQPEEKLRAVRGKFRYDDDSTVDRLMFRGNKSWVLSNDRTGRFSVYNYDVKTGVIGDAVFEHPEVDVDDVAFDPVTGQLSAVRYQDDRMRVFWIDPKMKALQTKLDGAIKDAVNLPVGWSNDENRVLIWSASASDPGRYYLLDRKKGQMHPVVESYPDIDPASLSEVQSIRYQARDGLTLRGYLTFPRGREPKGLPLIVLPHGGPFARDDWSYDPFVQFLANRGYAVLQPEFRGTTGFGKDFVARGYGEIGKKMQDDLDDGVDWLAKDGRIDPKRVCMVGFSYGGYAAMWGAIRNPERYRCAVSWAGPSDMNGMMRYDRQLFSASRYFREWRKRFQTGEELDQVSPVKFASQLKVPVFIAHGEEDDTVPAKQSHKMVEALTAAGAPVTSAFYKDSKHNFGGSKDIESFLTKLEAFLDKHNPS